MDERSFVPEGIDQDSWLGFEQRIQQRRVQALVDTARQALDNGDRGTAREALAEARALSPDESELSLLERQLAEPGRSVYSRHGVRLAIVLAVGAVIVVALGTLRDPVEAPAPTVATSTAPIPPPAATNGVADDTPSAVTPPPDPPSAAPAIAVDPAPRPQTDPAPPAPMRVVPRTDEEQVAFALKRYGRTFTGFNFADCAISMRGAGATAVCRTAGALPIWDVELSRQDEGWMIDNAVAREK